MSDIQNICYCYTCMKEYKSGGISRHRAMHRNRKENCKIMYSDGSVRSWYYGEPKEILNAKILQEESEENG